MKLLTLSFLYYFSFISFAHAYLDPGTGTIIISTIIAFVVSAWNYVKLYYNKLKNFIKKKITKNN